MTQHKILIVDDNPFVLFGLKKDLQHEGFKILTADNGQKAIEIVRNEQVDLVLTDLVMNPIDGIEVLKQTKEFNDSIKVIIMTGYNSTASSLGPAGYAIDDFITKPCETEEFYLRINNCLKEQNRENEIKETTRSFVRNVPFHKAQTAFHIKNKVAQLHHMHREIKNFRMKKLVTSD